MGVCLYIESALGMAKSVNVKCSRARCQCSIWRLTVYEVPPERYATAETTLAAPHTGSSAKML